MLSDMFDKRVLVLGVGNTLYGDDGFGPAVAERLVEKRPLPCRRPAVGKRVPAGEWVLPDDVLVADVGTSVREVLFDLLLSEKRPEKVIIIDAVDEPGRRPGEVFELPIDRIPANKIADFSLHQFPTVMLLHELEEYANLDVVVIAAQVVEMPRSVAAGLSESMDEAVRDACRLVCRHAVVLPDAHPTEVTVP